MERNDRHTWTLPFTDKPVLDLEATAAAIDVFPVGPGESPRLEASTPTGVEIPAEVRQEDGAVRVRISPFELRWLPFLMQGSRNPFELKLFLPTNIRARIRSDMGRLRVEKLEGCDLDLTVHAGAIILRNVRGRFAVRADAGNIRGHGLGGSFDVEAGASAVHLGIVALDPGKHRVHSSMGSVRVELASGLPVRVEARTVMGSTRNRYPSAADAPAVLHLETELGAVRVDPLDAPADERHGDWDDWRKYWSGVDGKSWFWPEPPAAPPPSGKPPAPSAANDEELKRILDLVQQGKIDAQQAHRLIRAMEGQ